MFCCLLFASIKRGLGNELIKEGLLIIFSFLVVGCADQFSSVFFPSLSFFPFLRAVLFQST